MEKFDQQKYKNAFNREKYENIVVRVPAGSRASINVQAREKRVFQHERIHSGSDPERFKKYLRFSLHLLADVL